MTTSNLKVVCSLERSKIEHELLAEGKDVYKDDKTLVDEKVERFKKNYIENCVLEEQA